MTPDQTNLAFAGASLVVGGIIGGLVGWAITHGYYLKQKKDSDQLPEKIGECVVKDLPGALIAFLQEKVPGMPTTPEIRTAIVHFAKTSGTTIANHDYTAKGKLKLWGAAGTILGGSGRENPPATAYIDRGDGIR